MPAVHEYGVCIKVLTVDADALSGFLGIVIAMVPTSECLLIPMIEIIGQGCFAVGEQIDFGTVLDPILDIADRARFFTTWPKLLDGSVCPIVKRTWHKETAKES